MSLRCGDPMGLDMRWVEVTRYGGNVPPMFWLRDPDGNSLIVVQPLV